MLLADAFRHYVDRFDREDDELCRYNIPNADAWAILSTSIPLFECPDQGVERGDSAYMSWSPGLPASAR